MRLLLIGASGFIGGTIYQYAQRHGIEIIGTSTRGGNGLLAYDLEHDTPKKFLNYSSDKQSEKTFALVAAAKTNINFCHANKQLTNKINVERTKDLLSFFYEHDIKTLYFSSDYVFDGKNGNYSEDSPVNPVTVYGVQKALMEEFILDNLPSTLIYRITKNVDDEYRDKNLFKELYDDYRAGKVLRCICGLKFNPTYVEDLAQCVFTGLNKNLYGLYNVANPEMYTRAELVKKFIHAHDTNYSSIIESDVSTWNFSEPKPLNTTLNVTKFQKATQMQFTSMDVLIKNFWLKCGGR